MLNLFNILKLLFLDSFCYIITCLIPKSKKIWIFGSWFGQRYADNSRVLYESAWVKELEGISCFWIYKNINIKESIYVNGVYAYSLRGIWLQMRAGVAVLVQNKDDFIRAAIGPRTVTVQLWHGYPIKKIGRDARRKRKNGTIEFIATLKLNIKYFIFPYLMDSYDLVCATGELDCKIFGDAFYLKRNGKISITGYPRNDLLFINKERRHFNNKKMLYMPTFRGLPNSEFDLFFQFGWNTERINNELAAYGWSLDVRFHPAHRVSDDVISIVQSENIRVIRGPWDPADHLGDYSLLVTDYSSVYADYSILSRSVVLAQFDVDRYISESRDSYIDFRSLPATARVESWHEFCDLISRIDEKNGFAGGDLIKFHKYLDGLSSKRVVDAVLEILGRDK